MSARPVAPHEAARQDVLYAIDYYLAEVSAQVALDFVDALEATYAYIGHAPTTGSPRYAHELNMAGLRSWPLGRFPFLVFYFEHDDRIDVWRVLHTARDVPAWMQAD